MQFDDIIGQQRIKQRLMQTIRDGHVAHAQLFVGPSGVGKLQLAIAYAQYLNCGAHSDLDSCGQCPTCIQYQHLEHPDLHFVFPIVKTDKKEVCDDYVAEFRDLILTRGYFDLEDWHEQMGSETKQSMIYEKESSEILRKLSLKSFGDGYKVMIIWQAEKMNVTCANKLLKLLEEPPEKTVFILISEHPESLLPTILSRVQTILIPRLDEKEIAAALITHDQATPQQAQDMAHIANGSYLQAKKQLKIIDEQNQHLDDFIALMRDAYTVGVLDDRQKKFESLQRLRNWSQEMADSKVGREKQKSFLQYAQQQLRENYIRNFHLPQLNYQTSAESRFSERFSPFIHSKNVENIMDELGRAEQQIAQNANAKMVFFDLCLQMIVLIKKK